VKREHLWPAALVGALVATVGLNGYVAYVANRGDGAQVEPDYYRRAVQWDSTLAEQARSRALGWRIAVQVAAPTAGGSVIDVEVRDAQGAPIAGARVRLDGFAVARATSSRMTAALTESAAGAYGAELPVHRVEWHEFQLTVDRGADHFVAQLRCLPGQACQVA